MSETAPSHHLLSTLGLLCEQPEEPEWDIWHWYPYWPRYQCDPQPWRHVREMMMPGRGWPHLCMWADVGQMGNLG